MKKLILLTAALLTLTSCTDTTVMNNDPISDITYTEPAQTEKLSEESAAEKSPKESTTEKLSEESTSQPPETAVSDAVSSQEDEYFRSLKDEYFRSLEDSEIDKEKIKQLNGEELKNVDFTDCSIGVFSAYGEKILEYLSAEDVESFIDCIAKAEIGSEEFEPKKSVGGGGSLMYQITLKTGEQIYIGALYYGNSHDPMLIINREHGYWCDKASIDKITQYQSIAYNNFDKAAAEYAESVTANVVS